MAAVTDYHTLTGLKQHKFTMVQFWRLEVLKSRCQQGCVPFGGPRGESFPCLFHLLEATHTSWLIDQRHFDLCLCHHLLVSDWPSYHPVIRTLVITLALLDNPGYLSVSRSWTYSHQQSSFLSYSQGLRYDIFGGHYWTYDIIFQDHEISEPCFSYLLLSWVHCHIS